MTSEGTQAEPKAGAKLCSRIAMAFSSAWIAVLTVCKGAGLVKLDVDEIIISGAAIVEDWCEYTVSEVLSSRREKVKTYKAFRNMLKSEAHKQNFVDATIKKNELYIKRLAEKLKPEHIVK